jgi:hypothetical protein
MFEMVDPARIALASDSLQGCDNPVIPGTHEKMRV